jgi:KRAB domain-containing zinc finger protein
MIACNSLSFPASSSIHFLYFSAENDDNATEEGEESDGKDEKKDFNCDQCLKKFKQSWKLRQHLIAHARRDEMKKYECDKCAASFISEWLLLRHAKIHTGLFVLVYYLL